MFKKILIANRGEIACRVMATCRRMGIRTVAVCSAADANAMHVALADEAFPIGPAPARQSYLVIEKIIDVARRSGAEAVHPGYGFLSENPDFADACEAAGIVFIGPPASAMRAMGSKAAAKALMERADVPLVPGYHGAAQDLVTLTKAAEQIGYPVLIKASAGGGGKGMRIVTKSNDLGVAIEGAQREAASSFGDDRLLIEKYLTRPRHIEIQVFADTLGNCVSLFERDCSIQRRHQKVVEEAPAPGLDPARRKAMGDAAVAAAQAVGYVGAGTVEFIVEDGRFYFMEMNTRLQVEHPVTEMITGAELVEWQLRVASGERLPLLQDELHLHGHAIEMRVYAEDPQRDYMPSIGRLVHLRQPRESAHVRVDTGVRQGDLITPNYDPMIAKLIVWGEDRQTAVRRLAVALGDYEVVGVQTNLSLLRAIAGSAAFAAADLDTGFLVRHAPSEPAPVNRAIIRVAAALALLAGQGASPASAADPWSPWDASDSWRMNGDYYQDLHLLDGETAFVVHARRQQGGSVRLELPEGAMEVTVDHEIDGAMIFRIDGVQHRVRVIPRDRALVIIENGRNHIVHLVDRLAPPRLAAAAAGKLVAPIPARVARVMVAPGDVVIKGTILLVLEAMKMELTLSAPADGTVASVRAVVDEMVTEGVELITFA
jgi:3-methylcrotonyl-CoA carboxylase alpha subunit